MTETGKITLNPSALLTQAGSTSIAAKMHALTEMNRVWLINLALVTHQRQSALTIHITKLVRIPEHLFQLVAY